jgi:hypothetical protein
MAKRAEQFDDFENPERRKDSGLEAVDNHNGAKGYRVKMHALLDKMESKKYVTSKEVQAWRQGVEASNTLDAAQGFYKFIESSWQKAENEMRGMDGMMQQAISQKIMSGKDRDFLIHHLLLTDEHNFVGKTLEAKKKLTEKIEHMRRDKDKLTQFAHHKLVGDSGMLVVDKNTQLEVPNEEKFLKMTVPERRKLLAALEEALPKAEAYAKEAGTVEGDKLTVKYDGLLKGALERGIIGQKTYRKFIESFKKLKKEDKDYWVAEFPNEMVRYETLWNNIRSTLEGSALGKMEAAREVMGYSELFQHFGEVQREESERMVGSYAGKLREARDVRKIIGQHTYESFLNGQEGIRNVPFKMQKTYLAQFENQMTRYQNLWDEVKTLKPGDRKAMEGLRDEYGYAELRGELEHLKTNPGDHKLGASDPLSRIKDDRKRTAIREAAELLNEQGKEQKQGFMSRVRSLFGRPTEDVNKTTGYQEKLNKARKVQQEKTEHKEEIEGTQTMNNVVDMQAWAKAKRAKTEKTEASGTREQETATVSTVKALEAEGADVRQDRGFTQAKIKDIDGKTQRVTRVEINQRKGLQHFLQENKQERFMGKAEGGNDDVTLTIRSKEGQKLDLNVHEIQAMRDHLRKEDLDKAA